jgi:O-antigen ligase
MTVLLYLGVRRTLVRGNGGFDLGRFDRPVAIGALLWMLGALFFVLVSSTTLASLLIVVGLLAIGLVYYLTCGRSTVLCSKPDPVARTSSWTRSRPAPRAEPAARRGDSSC